MGDCAGFVRGRSRRLRYR